MIYQRTDRSQRTLDELMIEQVCQYLGDTQEALQFMLFWHAVGAARQREQSRPLGLQNQMGALAVSDD